MAHLTRHDRTLGRTVEALSAAAVAAPSRLRHAGADILEQRVGFFFGRLLFAYLSDREFRIERRRWTSIE